MSMTIIRQRDKIYLDIADTTIKWEQSSLNNTEKTDDDINNARQAVSKILDSMPENIEKITLFERSKLYLRLNQYNKAYEDYRRSEVSGNYKEGEYFEGAIAEYYTINPDEDNSESIYKELLQDLNQLPTISETPSPIDKHYWLGWAYLCRANIEAKMGETSVDDYKLAETYLPNTDQTSPITAMPTKEDARASIRQLNAEANEEYFQGEAYISIQNLKQTLNKTYKQLAQQMDSITQAANIYDHGNAMIIADKIIDLTKQAQKDISRTITHTAATKGLFLTNKSEFLEAIQILESGEKAWTTFETSEDVILYGGVVNNLIATLNEYWFKYKSNAKNMIRNFDEDKTYYDAIIKKAHDALKDALKKEKDPDLRKGLVDRLITLLTNQATGASLFDYNFNSTKGKLEAVVRKYQYEGLTNDSALHQLSLISYKGALKSNDIASAKSIYAAYRDAIAIISPAQKLFMADLDWANNLFYLGRAYSEAIDVLEGMEERLINLPESGGDSAAALARDPNWATLRAEFFLMYGNALRSHAWNQLALINDEADNTTFAQELFSKAITKYDAASFPSDYLATNDLEMDAQDGMLLISAWQHIIAKDWQHAIDNVPQEADDNDNQFEGQIIRVIALSQQGKPTEDVCSKTLAIIESEVHDAHGNHLKTVLEGFCNK